MSDDELLDELERERGFAARLGYLIFAQPMEKAAARIREQRALLDECEQALMAIDRDNNETEITKAIGRGVAVAAGVMVLRGEHGFALEILQAGGIDSRAKLRACNVCDYDMKLCLDAIKSR